MTATVSVFAASSLLDAFTTLGAAFEKVHPGTTVRFDFDASSALATQIVQGAPADVFASASSTTMAQVTDAHAAASPTPFASNVLEIAVPPGNPAHIRSLTDLSRAGVKIATCDPAVPCGALASKVLHNAHVSVTPVSLEPDVQSTLTKVELGEVDAGLVYVTDVRAAGLKALGVAIPSDVNASTSYLIAPLTAAPNPTGAAAFVSYVLSAAGRAVLLADGFRNP